MHLALLIALLILSLGQTAALIFIAVVYYKKSNVRLIQKPSEELADFLADVRKHNFGVVRLDPDFLMLRSPR